MARVTAFQAVGRGFKSRLPLDPMSFQVYILKSEKIERYYIGSTKNIDRRLTVHNSSKARWTKRYQPWVVIHIEEFGSRGEALKRETFFKNLKNIDRRLDEIKSGKL